ncbi:MAG: hypothetical protein HO274_12285 [Ferrovum myxofaciens]|uniref:hypothetical protein n=1 Tax=Ferrovum myxofaciens TaxID=416213 RepID=UPI0023525E0A|nr:hypothetical protein [Ferrovum myxofaciens]QKE41990.1 MAG: hypothetical protein HO274_12285 [Ferrovum myxofaciens]
MTVIPTPPELMSARARAQEVASIIAAVIARLDSTRPRESDICLGFSAPKRLHMTPSQPGGEKK